MSYRVGSGIVTTYAGVKFRSRVEARWASFFDRLGWPWEYEPLDLNGYIPDFVLTFHEPVLVEVKHELNLRALESYAEKVDKSGWRGERIIVGARLFPEEHSTLEYPGCVLGVSSDAGGNAILRDCDLDNGHRLVDWPPTAPCLYGLGNDLGSYHCRRCGSYDGNPSPHAFDLGQYEWRIASNSVQWNPPKYQYVHLGADMNKRVPYVSNRGLTHKTPSWTKNSQSYDVGVDASRHMRTPFRYPGSKMKKSSWLVDKMPSSASYVDLFVGGGSVLIELAGRYPRAVLHANDADRRVAAFWDYIANSGNTRSLCKSIRGFKPSVEAFYELRDTCTPFTALGLNRCSFYGILHAAPIGGRTQAGQWSVGCRYNPEKLCDQVESVHALLHGRLTVSCGDFSLVNAPGHVYADPPYFVKGDQLYSERVDHSSLRDWLMARGDWTLSYDNCASVRSLYKDCQIEEVDMRYSIKGSGRESWESTKELFIRPKLAKLRAPA